MSGSDSAGVNAMVPGRKCECIVGVMRVRDFSTATEAGLESAELMAKFAEGSIVSSAAVIGAVHRSPLLGSYREHPGLQYRLGSNCRVHLSIGLHKGWAIEGAVGSEFKIDCSYLSPNVSIATSIERSTEVYNVSVIVAQSVWALRPLSLLAAGAMSIFRTVCSREIQRFSWSQQCSTKRLFPSCSVWTLQLQ
ncbi:PPM-type phosphatase domain-containing protein [Durusdinium trenchii]|uniref:PPM-type phosphatase domain-containing protein n=1 Tax=Durusdinium trenchii TaxID=1381693 RepID=A0ABP0R8R1_9DINO